jgi:ABC-2 type transport system permease protein
MSAAMARAAVGVTEAVRAEWGKIWSLRAPWLCIAGAAVLTVVTAYSLGNDFAYDVDRGQQQGSATTMPIVDALGPGVQLGALALVALAMIVVTSEYSTGLIRSTLLARPRRGEVLAGKTIVAAAIGLVAGAVVAAAGWVATDFALGSHVAPAASGPEVVARVAVVAAADCALTVALGAMLRSGVGTLTVAFVLVVGLDVLSPPVGAYTPAGAALAFISSDGSRYPSWVGALVVLLWAAAAQVAGAALLRRRDA